MDVFQKNSTIGLNYGPSSAYPFVLRSLVFGKKSVTSNFISFHLKTVSLTSDSGIISLLFRCVKHYKKWAVKRKFSFSFAEDSFFSVNYDVVCHQRCSVSRGDMSSEVIIALIRKVKADLNALKLKLFAAICFRPNAKAFRCICLCKVNKLKRQKILILSGFAYCIQFEHSYALLFTCVEHSKKNGHLSKNFRLVLPVKGFFLLKYDVVCRQQ